MKSRREFFKTAAAVGATAAIAPAALATAEPKKATGRLEHLATVSGKVSVVTFRNRLFFATEDGVYTWDPDTLVTTKAWDLP